MSKQQVFIFDGLCALAQSITRQLPKSFVARLFSHRNYAACAPACAQPVTAVALDNTHTITAQLKTCTHVVFASEILQTEHEAPSLQAYQNLVLAAYDACEDSFCQRFVFLSSASVYGPSKLPCSELGPCSPQTSAARTALQIEEELLRRSCVRSLKPTILRSATPFGQYTQGYSYAVLQQAAILSLLKLPLPKPAPVPLTLIHIDELAATLITCLQTRPEHDIYNVCGPATTAQELHHALAQLSLIGPAASPLPLTGLVTQILTGRIGPASDYVYNLLWQRIRRLYSLAEGPAPLSADLTQISQIPPLDTTRLRSLGTLPTQRLDTEHCLHIAQTLQEARLLPAPQFMLQNHGPSLRQTQVWSGQVVGGKKNAQKAKVKLRIHINTPLNPWPLGWTALHGKISIDKLCENHPFVGQKLLKTLAQSASLPPSTLSLLPLPKISLTADLTASPAPNTLNITIYDTKRTTLFHGQIHLDSSLNARLERLRATRLRFN